MKIGLVNDSKTALYALRSILEEEQDISVAWTAEDGEEAVRKARDERPDMILMDLIMPNVDGVEATRRIMQETPCPILIVTASVSSSVGRVFAAMGAGAMDVVATPPLGAAEPRRMLMEKIRSVAAVSNLEYHGKATGWVQPPPAAAVQACVLIGSSAGGPAALAQLLQPLPKDLPVGIVIVQHVDERFAGELAAWLGSDVAVKVRLAENGDVPLPGTALVSKGGSHLVFGRSGSLYYADQPKLSYHPSVDVLFESAVRYGPRHLLGILLTGMGRDGAEGLRNIRARKHLTIAQDEESSAIYGMPRAAAEIGAAAEILPPFRIAERIKEWSMRFL